MKKVPIYIYTCYIKQKLYEVSDIGKERKIRKHKCKQQMHTYICPQAFCALYICIKEKAQLYIDIEIKAKRKIAQVS